MLSSTFKAADNISFALDATVVLEKPAAYIHFNAAVALAGAGEGERDTTGRVGRRLFVTRCTHQLHIDAGEGFL